LTNRPLNPEEAVSSIKLLVGSRLANVRLLGLAVQAFCTYLNFGETEAYQVQLAMVEAVTNVIRHAYDGQPGREVEVTVTLQPQCLSFQVKDTGRPLPALNLQALEFDPGDVDHLPEGGMGLVIMHHVMDRVEYCRVGETNILKMEKHFPARKPPGRSSGNS
jgi:serine/threonine-protein kinase RsbW